MVVVDIGDVKGEGGGKRVGDGPGDMEAPHDKEDREETDCEEEDEENRSISRSDSFTTAASSLSLTDICKICHCGSEDGESPLVSPCFCCGSLKFVHQDCLQRWIKSSDIKRCELCKFPFMMQSKVKPFCQWEKLDMTSLERRKLVFSVTFHAVAITCVVWSLYVLIDRTTEEVRSGELQWPFWTKLVVVAIGFTGGLVFMYIQCKVYFHLCKKWKAYNRIIVVQEMPTDMLKLRKPSRMKAVRRKSEDDVTSRECESRNSTVRTSAPPPEDVSSRRGSGREGRGSTEERRSREGSKTNAETQTSIHGINLSNALGLDVRDNTPVGVDSVTSEISVSTVSKLLEEMEGGGSGLNTVPAVLFFTDCELQEPKRISHPAFRGNRSNLAEPLLICDLPGQHLSLGSAPLGVPFSSTPSTSATTTRPGSLGVRHLEDPPDCEPPPPSSQPYNASLQSRSTSPL